MDGIKIKYVYWQDGEYWLGYIAEYPDYMTQGNNLKELQENLKDIYADISKNLIPGIRHTAEMEIN